LALAGGTGDSPVQLILGQSAPANAATAVRLTSTLKTVDLECGSDNLTFVFMNTSMRYKCASVQLSSRIFRKDYFLTMWFGRVRHPEISLEVAECVWQTILPYTLRSFKIIWGRASPFRYF
jgi:hypothetical protein